MSWSDSRNNAVRVPAPRRRADPVANKPSAGYALAPKGAWATLSALCIAETPIFPEQLTHNASLYLDAQ